MCNLDKPALTSDDTALHIAAKKGNTGCLECLVGYGASLDLVDMNGYSPLHVVLYKKNMKPLNSERAPHLNKVYDVNLCQLLIPLPLIPTVP